jgi:hypothetical protein
VHSCVSAAKAGRAAVAVQIAITARILAVLLIAKITGGKGRGFSAFAERQHKKVTPMASEIWFRRPVICVHRQKRQRLAIERHPRGSGQIVCWRVFRISALARISNKTGHYGDCGPAMSSAFVEHARNDHKSSVRFPMQSSPIQWDGQPASRAINLSRAMWPYGVATAIAVLAITICRRQAKCVQHMPWHHQAKKSYREHCCKDHDRDYFLHYATPYALNPPLSLNAPSNLQPVQYVRRNATPP